MNAKQILLTSTAICTACVAILLTQSVFSGFANAESNRGENNSDLRQRIEDLESMQEEDDKEFFLIDTSLSDLDMRVMDVEKRAGARAGRVNDVEKRLSTLRATMRAEHREIFRDLKEMRADIRELQDDD